MTATHLFFLALLWALPSGLLPAPVQTIPAPAAGYQLYLPLILDLPYQIFMPVIVVPQPPPPPATPPPYSTSIYVTENIDMVGGEPFHWMNPQTAYDLGYAAGQYDLALPGVQDSIIILDYGQPWEEDGVWGVAVFSDYDFYSLDVIAASAREFGHGYYDGTGADTASHITLGIGINSYGSYGAGSTDPAVRAAAAYQHGQAYAAMVESVANWTINNGYGSQVRIVAAKDIELAWNKAQVSHAWVNGYSSYFPDPVTYHIPYYNFGTCENCPTRLDTSLVPGNGWTLQEIWYTNWGAPPAWPIPEIYVTNGRNARQWAYLSYYAAQNFGGAITFPGLMTQWQACQQNPGDCNTLDNTPEQGWQQLYDEVHDPYYSGLIVQETIPWVTDIKWR
ncbi:MAG TPA: hypothetical protein PKG95_00585 [Anaerolineaceae bacterium]|nr:hypothetical protein [Anaerolineaceae bacterium]